MTGKFITFEGIDGSGKTTQIDLLETELKHRGISTLILREPGGTRLSEKIRDILLDRKNMVLSPSAESLLFVAARAQLIEEKIKPSEWRPSIKLIEIVTQGTYSIGSEGASS